MEEKSEPEVISEEWVRDLQIRNALYSLYRAYADRVRAHESQIFEAIKRQPLSDNELEKLTKKIKEFNNG